VNRTAYEFLEDMAKNDVFQFTVSYLRKLELFFCFVLVYADILM